MQKWEYKILYRSRGTTSPQKLGQIEATTWDVPDMGPKLQSLGAEGWELVSVWPESKLGYVTVEGSLLKSVDLAGITTHEMWVFKRPIGE
jgi:hypothetical protein